MSRLFPRTLTIEQAARLHRDRRHRVEPNAQLEALARFARIAGTIVAFVFVMAAMLAIDVAIWVPHVRP
jgi:cell division protein FtsX